MANISTNKSTISISIPQLITAVIFLITTSLSIGIGYNKLAASVEKDAAAEKDMGDLKTAVVKISTILETMQQTQKENVGYINQISEDSHTLKTEIVVINSKIEDLKKRRY